MTTLVFLLHQTVFGAVAAAGFGVMFNVAFRRLAWCAVSGALALAVRTSCQTLGLTLVGASFVAALTVGIAAHLRWRRTKARQDVLGVVGCIPMIPGSLASKAILGLYALTTGSVGADSRFLYDVAQYSLLVIFTLGAIGTGLLIPMLPARLRTH
jgi:uncharacterized membrane protein YjjB (DUF3815 family)